MESQIIKSILRKTILQYRRMLEENLFKKRNNALCKNLLSYLSGNNFKTIHTFLPIRKNREPNLIPLLPQLLESGVEIVISKTDFSSKKMHHFYYKKETRLLENSMNIPEPVNAELADFSRVDLILVPLLAADKTGNRIGYGGGFYDRLLLNTSASKVGLCLSSLLDEIIQVDNRDIRLDRVLTPFSS